MKTVVNRVLSIVAVALCMGSACATAAPVARVTLHSDPGDPVWGALDVTLTYSAKTAYTFVSIANWQFDPSALNLAQFVFANDPDPAADFVFLTFNTYPTQITPGFYSLAAPGGVVGQPTYDLGVTFREHSCSADSTSNFTVQQAQFGQGSLGRPTVVKFQADFVLNCFGIPSTLKGSLLFDATGQEASAPVPVPLSPAPVILALALAGGLLAAGKCRRRTEPCH